MGLEVLELVPPVPKHPAGMGTSWGGLLGEGHFQHRMPNHDAGNRAGSWSLVPPAAALCGQLNKYAGGAAAPAVGWFQGDGGHGGTPERRRSNAPLAKKTYQKFLKGVVTSKLRRSTSRTLAAVSSTSEMARPAL